MQFNMPISLLRDGIPRDSVMFRASTRSANLGHHNLTWSGESGPDWMLNFLAD
jgi:hypothetical protein